MRVAFIGDPSSKLAKMAVAAVDEQGWQCSSFKVSRHGLSDAISEYKNVRDGVIASDAVVADESLLRPELGYRLAIALEYRRPTIFLLPKALELSKHSQVRNRNLHVVRYSSISKAVDEMKKFLAAVNNSLDAKLFMNIPPSMNRYLDWVATHTRFSKSDVVRRAVERAADEDEEYQKFLKSLD